MKKTAYTLIALLVLVGSLAVAAQAQTSGRAQVRVNIPFQFHVGNTTMAAGYYTIQQLDANSAALRISGTTGANAIVNMLGAMSGTQSMSNVSFRRYANQYYFAEVWIDGEKDGWEAPKSKAERATQKELAALNVPMETVALRLP